MKRALSLWVLFFAAVVGYSQHLDNAEEAFRLAEFCQKPVLLVFAGSDWCAPCIRLERQVLSQQAFETYAKDHLVVLKADFPQRKKLSKEIKAQNDALAEKYNPLGQFPHVLLLRPDRTIITTVTYRDQTPEQFVAELCTHLAE